MHFHSHHYPQSAQDANLNHPSIAGGLVQAGQTLGSVGSPASHPSTNSATTNNTSYYPPSNVPTSTANPIANGSGYSSHPVTNSTSHYHNTNGTASFATNPSNSNPSAYLDTQLPQPYRQPQSELHLPSNRGPSEMSNFQMPPSYGQNETLPYHMQQTTPQQNPPPASSNIPGALQPGHMGRPVAHTMNTAPGAVPTLPQINSQLQEPSTPSRPSAGNHSHSYSRSSPAGLDQQKYKAYTSAGETPRIAPPSNFPLPSTATSYSPLGLADIRSHAGSGLGDGPLSPSAGVNNGEPIFPTISNHISPWPAYAIDWCKWPVRQNGVDAGKIAIGSYLEDSHNYIHVLDAKVAPPDPENPQAERGLEYVKTAEATHSYPLTRILWEPPSSNKQSTDLLATSGDHLRLWSLPSSSQAAHSNYITRPSNPKDTPSKLAPLALLSNSKSPEHTAPITSLDWNIVSPSLIITSSIDTTCTIWDIPTLTAKTQLIAHDKEVYDVRFCAQSVDVFVSCGADGSVRMFDLRSLEHSTIIYEPSEKDKSSLPSPGNVSPGQGPMVPFPPPLLRIAASPHDAHLLATFSQDSSVVRVLDVRQPGQALLELKGHSAPVNCIEWSHNRRGLLASGADDSLVMIWDLMSYAGAVTGQTGAVTTERGPSAAWECDYEVSNLSWAPGENGLGVVGGKGFWAVSM